MSTTNSQFMSLPVPVVGSESGPQYATDINSCLTIVDQHSHSPGSGVQVTPAGLDINSDLAFNSNNLTLARSVRFTAQGSPISGVSDLDCVYVAGVDLYYNDGNGNQVRITQSGGVAGSPGSIANLTNPASASYVAVDSTFVWQSDVSTAASLDCASVVLRNSTASSHGLTLSPPNAMGADMAISLPSLPASNLPVSIDNSGNMTAAQVTLAQLSSQVQNLINIIPTVQRLTSGSGTYTTPANCTYLKIKMVGGGGGGAGSGFTNPGGGGSGGDTTFSNFLTAGGGGGGRVAGTGAANGGDGGAVTVSAPAITVVSMSGNGGGAGFAVNGSRQSSGVGGAGPFGGVGAGSIAAIGNASADNSGSGGSGGGGTGTDGTAGSGGGSGGYIEVIIPTPSASYTYAIGGGGAQGSAGSTGYHGGAGGSGVIIIEEHYGS